MVGARMNGKSEMMRYRLRPPVRVQEKNGGLFLLSNFPLKAMILNASWRPVFDRLSRGDWVLGEEISQRMTTANPQKVESFLEHLVRKGYLEQKGLPALPDFPLVSVIVPVRNRANDIAACLQSLLRLRYPPEKLDLIVVDDASEDGTSEVISTFPVHCISMAKRSQASFCRNVGAQQAKGEILAFTDSDCQADALWLRELVPAFREPGIGVVGGVVDSVFEAKAVDRYEKVKSSLHMGRWFRRSEQTDRLFYVPSCNLLTRKDLFVELGGFRADLHVGEDVDYCWRVQDRGYEVEYRPRGKISHRHRNSLWGFCSRRFDYGTSEPLLQHLHRSRAKILLLPLAASLFWVLAALSLWHATGALFALCGLLALIDSGAALQKLKTRGIPGRVPEALFAVLRSYLAFFFYACAFVSRYYLLWTPALIPFFPKVGTALVAAHLLSSMGEYVIKKPRLDFFSFLFLFSLEQVSYQAGVWCECARQRFFAPVNPRLSIRLSPK
jgi:mycofactocin system glycosyltransferase